MTLFIGFMYLNKEDLMKDGEMDVLSRRTVHALMLMMINEAVCQ
jgi:acid stress-induced BolA-like protein IbaG/YrbA